MIIDNIGTNIEDTRPNYMVGNYYPITSDTTARFRIGYYDGFGVFIEVKLSDYYAENNRCYPAYGEEPAKVDTKKLKLDELADYLGKDKAIKHSKLEKFDKKKYNNPAVKKRDKWK
jgi:hypothetical protein